MYNQKAWPLSAYCRCQCGFGKDQHPNRSACSKSCCILSSNPRLLVLIKALIVTLSGKSLLFSCFPFSFLALFLCRFLQCDATTLCHHRILGLYDSSLYIENKSRVLLDVSSMWCLECSKATQVNGQFAPPMIILHSLCGESCSSHPSSWT